MCRKNAEMFKAIREAAGWDVDLSLRFTASARRFRPSEIGKAIEPYRIHFFEDPFLDIPEVARYVTEKCPVPVAMASAASTCNEHRPRAEHRRRLPAPGYVYHRRHHGRHEGSALRRSAQRQHHPAQPAGPDLHDRRAPHRPRCAETSRCRSGRARSATSTR